MEKKGTRSTIYLPGNAEQPKNLEAVFSCGNLVSTALLSTERLRVKTDIILENMKTFPKLQKLHAHKSSSLCSCNFDILDIRGFHLPVAGSMPSGCYGDILV